MGERTGTSRGASGRPPHAGELPDGLLSRVRGLVADGADLPDGRRLGAMVRELGGVVGRDDLDALAGAVRAELVGAGPLQRLLEDPTVTDVLVNGPREVWVDKGRGLERVQVDLGDADRVRGLAVRLAAAGGRRLDDASPLVDARLPDGTRLHAVLPPVADGCALLSLRVLRRTAFTLPELEAAGTLTPLVAATLRALVARRATVLVSGATGTGKTTLLSALLSLVPPHERIVCIEEAGELAPDHPHVVRLLERRANVEGAGAVDLATLVRQALRMRPDRLVLGECRGAEVREVLTALNTGHEGGCATVHANTAEDVAARLEALGALAGLGPAALATQAASALDAVVHLRRDGPVRWVQAIGTVGVRDGRLVVERVAGVERAAGRAGAERRGPGWPAFAERWGVGGWGG